MEDNITNSIIDLYKLNKWEEIVDKYHAHPDRNRLLWVYPSVENFAFLGGVLKELGCERVLSVGCGSGLLEWMIIQATGYPVTGVEVDGTWWHSKYAPSTFIPLLLTTEQLDTEVITALRDTKTALLFCYFNNRPAFEQYLRHFEGKVLIIIGPDGNGAHTDPHPFENIPSDWQLLKWQEVRKSKDFIAVYCKIK